MIKLGIINEGVPEDVHLALKKHYRLCVDMITQDYLEMLNNESPIFNNEDMHISHRQYTAAQNHLSSLGIILELDYPLTQFPRSYMMRNMFTDIQIQLGIWFVFPLSIEDKYEFHMLVGIKMPQMLDGVTKHIHVNAFTPLVPENAYVAYDPKRSMQNLQKPSPNNSFPFSVFSHIMG